MILIPAVLLALACNPLPGNVLRVGSTQTYANVGLALAAASAGDLILVDAGTYPAFTVTTAVTIAPSGSNYSVTQSSSSPAITISGTSGTVAVSGANISFSASGSPAISVVNCTADVRLQSIAVDKAAKLNGTSARAAIEVASCVDVILENVSVSSATARTGNTTNADGSNDGLSAVRFVDTQFMTNDCTLTGYNAPSGGSFGGDAIRVVTSGTFSPPSCWLLGTEAFAGGSSSGNGGNCLHQIGTGSALAPELCGGHTFSPGSGGTLAGGDFAINNDGGVVSGGHRAIPGCVLDTVGFTTAPAIVTTGTSFNVIVSDSNGGTSCALFMSFGSRYAHSYSGLSGRWLLDPATTSTIGFGTTPATFSISVPSNPSLVGSQVTAQGVVSAGGVSVTATPVMIAVH